MPQTTSIAFSHKPPLYLSALGIACTLGLDKQAVVENLFKINQDFLKSTTALLSGKTVSVGRILFDMPLLGEAYQDLESRNNALLKISLDEISTAVLNATKKYGSSRVGVVLGTSTSGMHEGEQAFSYKKQMGCWPEFYHYSRQEIASPSLFTARYFGLTGPAYTISTACSSSSKALCSARRLIQSGICDAVITGGVDTLCDVTLNGFDSLDLLSEKPCNPFSKYRHGITIGEGAAVFLLTREENEQAPLVEFMGGGESSDAYHISAPEPTGKGAEIAIRNALEMADLKPEEIDYINLHGTGTLLNDAMESASINRIFSQEVPCSSTKALTGHTLGAAGAIEAAILWLCLNEEKEGIIPLPPHNWDGVKDETLLPIHLVKENTYIKASKDRFILMSNSFAFGGSNVSVILGKKNNIPPLDHFPQNTGKERNE